MFDNLVESGSHKQDLSRKGSFILGTIAIYAVLGLAFLIGSIMVTVTQLDTGDLELTTLVAPVPVPQQAQPEKKQEEAKPQKRGTECRRSQGTDCGRQPDRASASEVSAKASDVPPVRHGVTTVLGASNSNASCSASQQHWSRHGYVVAADQRLMLATTATTGTEANSAPRSNFRRRVERQGSASAAATLSGDRQAGACFGNGRRPGDD